MIASPSHLLSRHLVLSVADFETMLSNDELLKRILIVFFSMLGRMLFFTMKHLAEATAVLSQAPLVPNIA